MTENTFSQPQTWTRSRILFSALAARITLVLYSHIHDYIFKVNFTDIDYHVFSDAARHVWKGGSPYDRPTYRYTPALAWILLPVVNFPDFGKLLFCFCDIFVAWIMLQVLDRQELQHKKESTKNTTSENNKKICLLDDQVKLVVLFWLANPLTAIISARGNAEAIVAAAVLLTILLLQTGYWKTAALVHGALAIHLKIYPLIYLPSVFLQLSSYGKQKDFSSKFKALLFNWKGHVYLIITLSSFAAIVLFFYQIYGDTFLEEFLLYHVKRRDIKHNFSPYFYPLYLVEGNEFLSKLIGFCAFLPQVFHVMFYAFWYFNDLPFCWFMSTFAFVAYNKVCTSQYFVWYIVLLPLVASRINMETWRAVKLTSAWLGAQGIWLLVAYLYEFRGWNTFLHMFLASLLFLFVNAFILRDLLAKYKHEDFKLKAE